MPQGWNAMDLGKDLLERSGGEAEISGSLEDGIPRNFARGGVGLSEMPGKRMDLLEIQRKIYAQYAVLL